MFATRNELMDAIPDHIRSGRRVPPTRYVITYLEEGHRLPVTDADSLPMGANHADIALVYARDMSIKFSPVEYAVFDILHDQHMPHYYVGGQHSPRPHRNRMVDMFEVVAEATYDVDTDTLTPTRESVIAATNEFVRWINESAEVPTGYSYTCEVLTKRIRIVMIARGGVGRSVHAFVDMATGDLLKASSWSAPAKGARGNLLTGMDEIKQRFDWSGRYLYRKGR